jgi:serine/threonine-protein kinase
MGDVPSAIGRYTPVGRLGSGGMAEVFLVVQRGPERVEKLAVVKRLRNPEKPELVQMFLDEARLAVRLSHPNIVHTYEVAETNGEYFMTMEYVEGQPLVEILAALADRNEGLSDACVASIAVQALKGLHYAHEFCDFDGTPLAIVHRDVSPHNVFVTYGGEAKILDFGIAKAHLNSTQTETGIIKGKLKYMSPEQAGQEHVDRRSDIFATGVVVWEMLARRQLFTGDAIAVLNQVIAPKIPPLREVRSDISAALAAIVEKALARSPDDRYQTAEEMWLDLQRAFPGAGGDESRAEVARVIREMFATERDWLRSQVRAHLAKPTDSASHPSFKGPLPMLSARPPSSDTTALPAIASEVPPASPVQRRRLMMLAAVALGGAAVVAAIKVSRHPAPPPAPAPSVVVATTSEVVPAAPPAKVHLHLETTPPGAYVEWDGERFGPTPTDFSVRPGPQKLEIVSDGYDRTSLTIDAQPGADLSRAVTLQAAAAAGVSSAAAVAAHGTRRAPVRPSRPAAAQPATATPAAPTASSRPELKVEMLDDEGH